jgi:hypothetical protein
MKCYLLHGYGLALSVGYKTVPSNCGFEIFEKEIEKGDVRVFDWAMRYPRTKFSSYNLVEQYKLYRQEQKWIEDAGLQEKVWRDMTKFQPEVVICHSTGCRLFWNLYQKFGELESVKLVIFVQADMPMQKELLEVDFKLINIHCVWDQALVSSTVINKYIPIGLSGGEGLKNIFWPLTKGPNPHQDVWRDAKFKFKLLEVTEGFLKL